jgi:RNA polymerase sigma-70 factor (ECF subfamily)
MHSHSIVDSYAQETRFRRLLRPHLDRLYRFAHRLTGSATDADDLLQDALVKVFARLDDLAAIEKPGPWLCRVMYNHFIDERRMYYRRLLVSVDEEQLHGGNIEQWPGGNDPQALAQRADDIMRLDRALSVLSDEHRLVVLLHDVEGYKLSEIQVITGDPLGTVKSRLHRARARLREIISSDETFLQEETCSSQASNM